MGKVLIDHKKFETAADKAFDAVSDIVSRTEDLKEALKITGYLATFAGVIEAELIKGDGGDGECK